MNLDFGEVLARARQITWKQRVLWIIGFVFGSRTVLFIAKIFFVLLIPVLAQGAGAEPKLELPGGLSLVFILFLLVIDAVEVMAQRSLCLGIVDPDRPPLAQAETS